MFGRLLLLFHLHPLGREANVLALKVGIKALRRRRKEMRKHHLPAMASFSETNPPCLSDIILPFLTVTSSAVFCLY
jgi:hypothetical protein